MIRVHELEREGMAGRFRGVLRVAAAMLMLMAFGCSDATGPSDDDLRDIGGGLVFSLTESFDAYPNGVGLPRPTLDIETEGSFGCWNYAVAAELGVVGNVVSVATLGVVEPTICLTAVGPARWSHVVPVEVGSYRLQFHFSEFTDEYRVLVTSDALRIETLQASFTEPAFSVFWRFPHRSFGLLCDRNVSGEGPCTELEEVLRSSLPVEEFSFPSGGRVPYPDSHVGHGHDFKATFYQFERDDDFDAAKGVFCEFVAEAPRGLAVLTSWMNEQLASWVPDHCES